MVSRQSLIYQALILRADLSGVYIGLFFLTFLRHQPRKVLPPPTVLYIHYGARFVVLDLVQYLRPLPFGPAGVMA